MFNLSDGAFLMVLGALMALARNAPLVIWRWLYSRFVITVEVQNNDVVFDWLLAWLAEQPYSKRARNLTATSRQSADGTRTRVLFTPAPGNHIIRYGHRLLWIQRERKEPTAGGAKSESAALFLMYEVFYIRVLGLGQDTAQRFIEDARRAAERQTKEEPSIYIVRWGYWHKSGPLRSRPIDSVILPAGVMEELLEEVREFLESRDWYRRMGIPYRTGFLFEGVPGSGKSSVVSALAGHLGIDLYLLTMSGEDFNDERLMALLANVRDGSIILCEDADSCLNQRTFNRDADGEKKPTGVTFSGFINALDGVAAREGCMVFLTTNHKDELDEALIRPGRVDREIHFDYADADQLERIFLRFFPGETEMAIEYAARNVLRRVRMSDVQNDLRRNRLSAVAALNSAPDTGVAV